MANINAHIRASEAEIEGFSLILERFLRDNLKKIVKAIKAGEENILDSINVINSIERELNAAGYNKVLSKIEGVYARELTFIRDYFAESKIRSEIIYSDADRAVVDALIKYDYQSVNAQVQQYIGSVKRAMLNNVILGQVPQFEEIHDKASSKLESNVKTEINTSIAGFSRTVTQNKAKELGIDRFQYVGPLDSVTRPFCRAHIGKTYTTAEIGSLDNGQGLPVRIYCGGYNCRHLWVPVRS